MTGDGQIAWSVLRGPCPSKKLSGVSDRLSAQKEANPQHLNDDFFQLLTMNDDDMKIKKKRKKRREGLGRW